MNDTGGTFGGNSLTGNNATCTRTGANIAQQDCSKGRDANPVFNSSVDGAVGFSFTTISNAGAALPASAALGAAANDWACTYDNVTGFMWEIKTSSGRRRSAHTYTWFSSDASNNAGATGTANGGTCGDSGQCDTEKFAQLTNIAGFCGRNDWRMPRVKELNSIVHLGLVTPTVDVVWFPNTLAVSFWSGLPGVSTGNAWHVRFNSGDVRQDSRSLASQVRLVRAGQ